MESATLGGGRQSPVKRPKLFSNASSVVCLAASVLVVSRFGEAAAGADAANDVSVDAEPPDSGDFRGDEHPA